MNHYKMTYEEVVNIVDNKLPAKLKYNMKTLGIHLEIKEVTDEIDVVARILPHHSSESIILNNHRVNNWCNQQGIIKCVVEIYNEANNVLINLNKSKPYDDGFSKEIAT